MQKSKRTQIPNFGARPRSTSAICESLAPNPVAFANRPKFVLYHRGADPRTVLEVSIAGPFACRLHILTYCDRCGEVKRLVMGLDRFNKTPCGFCFVEYYTHQDALDCLKYIGGTKLDERIIRTDLDPGFEEGRQYGYVGLFLSLTANANALQSR